MSTTSCILVVQPAESALHLFRHCIVTSRIPYAAFNWLEVCMPIPATYFSCLYSSVDVLAVRKRRRYDLYGYQVSLGGYLGTAMKIKGDAM